MTGTGHRQITIVTGVRGGQELLELVVSNHYSFIRYMYACTTRTPEEGNFKISELMFDPISIIKSFIIGKMPFGNANLFYNASLDRLERDAISDTPEGYPDLTDLGVKLSTVEERLPWELAPFDAYGYYQYEDVNEKPVPILPQMVTMQEERAINVQRSNLPLSLLPIPAM